MAIDFSALLYGPVYTTLGVTCVFTTEDAGTITVTALDKSAGIQVGNDGIAVQTLAPAVVVRVADLVALDVEASALDGAELAMNGKTWRVESVQPRPSPNGEDDGEVYCSIIRVTE